MYEPLKHDNIFDEVERARALLLSRMLVQLYPFSQKRILDLGCGDGLVTYHIAHSFEAQVYGCDMNAQAVQLARELFNQRCTWDVSLRTTLPYQDNFFDAVSMIEVFHHISEEDRQQILYEALRVVKTEGCLVVIEPQYYPQGEMHASLCPEGYVLIDPSILQTMDLKGGTLTTTTFSLRSLPEYHVLHDTCKELDTLIPCEYFVSTIQKK